MVSDAAEIDSEAVGTRERIIAGLLDAHAGEAGPGECRKDAVDLYGKVFRGRNQVAKNFQRVQVGRIEPVEQVCSRERIQIAQVADHSGFRVDGAAERDLDDVVVPVPVRIVALAVDGAIVVRGEGVRVQPVRRAEVIAAREVRPGSGCGRRMARLAGRAHGSP